MEEISVFKFMVVEARDRQSLIRGDFTSGQKDAILTSFCEHFLNRFIQWCNYWPFPQDSYVYAGRQIMLLVFAIF